MSKNTTAPLDPCALIGVRVHYLQHVPFEGLGSIEGLLIARGCTLSRTCMYREGHPLPTIDMIDALIVMGGPMGVHDDASCPWLTPEKKLIASVIRRGIPVLGVCLGAQLIADVLGAAVTRNEHEEIGWFPVRQTGDPTDQRMKNLPTDFHAMHWHGDTFAIPSGATNFISSEGCANQAFVYGENVLALQFHLEMLPSHVRAIYRECGKPDKTGRYIQRLDEMLLPAENFHRAGKILEELLETFIFKNLPP